MARELTKQFEEFRRGTVRELGRVLHETAAPRGEVVLVIAGREAPVLDEDALRARARRCAADGTERPRRGARSDWRTRDAPRNLAYRLAHE